MTKDTPAQTVAKAASIALNRSPYSKGAEKLAADLGEKPMIDDSAAERNNHLEHCRNKVAGWCVRDVLDFLHERCATVEDYRLSASVCEMNAVDARNRERAALFMAGRPEKYTTTYTVHQNDITDLSPYPASVYGLEGEIAAVRNQGGDTARIARELAAAPDMLATLQIIYANAAESPEWIRARIAPVIAKATKGGE